MTATLPLLDDAEPAVAVAPTTISVIICAYTDERWDDIARGIESLRTQTLVPEQIVLVIDHNDELLEQAADAFASNGDDGPRLDVVANTMTLRVFARPSVSSMSCAARMAVVMLRSMFKLPQSGSNRGRSQFRTTQAVDAI